MAAGESVPMRNPGIRLGAVAMLRSLASSGHLRPPVVVGAPAARGSGAGPHAASSGWVGRMGFPVHHQSPCRGRG
eukprot:8337392-Alexandrium_andersonii.AAC.2